jgi:hypothetical protein
LKLPLLLLLPPPCSVAAKAAAEAEAERLRADNTALEARLRTMVAREVRRLLLP